ncbi:proline-rich receptor-like protein kinase PERK2 [Iris pallida]|uniref:Proline-rich receptor-like protein kinase PERK2 n=1 Tax=Iris pallida TaxID=29817 RepID=A0AAX6FD14_IRIPA|nr:proline-rich receptor-like protein kinase PERK2 [Iris pallida]
MMLVMVCGVLGRSGTRVGRVAAAVCGGGECCNIGLQWWVGDDAVVVTGKVWWCLAWGEWQCGCGGGTGSQGSAG